MTSCALDQRSILLLQSCSGGGCNVEFVQQFVQRVEQYRLLSYNSNLCQGARYNFASRLQQLAVQILTKLWRHSWCRPCDWVMPSALRG